MNFLAKFWKWIKSFFKKNEGQKNQIGDKNTFVKSKIIQRNTKIGEVKIDKYITHEGVREEKVEEVIRKHSAEIKNELSKSREEYKKLADSLAKKPHETTKKWPDDYYKIKEVKKFLFDTFNPEDKEGGDKYGYNLLLQGALMLKLRESVVNILDYLFEIDLKYMEEEELDGIKRTLVMIFNLFDFKVWKDKNRKMIIYCFDHIIRDCEKCFANKEKKEFNFKKDDRLQQFPLNENNEVNFWIIDDKSSVKEELIKEDIWNMRLEAWGDKEGKRKLNFWLVEKEDFKKKNLSQNKILSSNIIGKRDNMLVLKVKKDDEQFREELRKSQAINITETVLADKEAARNYEGHEAWLLEKEKVREILEKNKNIKLQIQDDDD